MTDTSSMPAGWYRDPNPKTPDGTERYWDGKAWTPQTRETATTKEPIPDGYPTVEQPGTGMTRPAWILLILSVIVSPILTLTVAINPIITAILLPVAWIILAIFAIRDRRILADRHIPVSKFSIPTVILGSWGYLTTRAIQMKTARGSFAAVAAALAFFGQFLSGAFAANLGTVLTQGPPNGPEIALVLEQMYASATDGETATAVCPEYVYIDTPTTCIYSTSDGQTLAITFVVDENGNFTPISN